MSFPFNFYLVAVASGFLTVLLTVPLWRRWALWIGLVDDPGVRKIHGTPVPLAGGLAVMTGLVVPTILGALALWFASPEGEAGEISFIGTASHETIRLRF